MRSFALAAAVLVLSLVPVASAHGDAASCQAQSALADSAQRQAEQAAAMRHAKFDRALALLEGPADIHAAQAQVDQVWKWHERFGSSAADGAAHRGACA